MVCAVGVAWSISSGIINKLHTCLATANLYISRIGRVMVMTWGKEWKEQKELDKTARRSA